MIAKTFLEIKKSIEEAKTFSDLRKFNPYHDRLGRFSTSGGASFFTIRTKDPNKQNLADRAIEREKLKTQSPVSTPKSTNPGSKSKNHAIKTPTKQDTMYPDSLAGVKRGKEMSFEEANEGRTNPNFNKGGGYLINCQTCVVANEARRRGYDVTAKPKNTPEADRLSRRTNEAWIDPKTGKHPDYIKDDTANTPKKAKEWLNNTIEEGNRYTMEFGWKGRSRSGHIINVYKEGGEVKFYDPQNGSKYAGKEVDQYLARVRLQTTTYGFKIPTPLKVLRVDDKQFNMNIVEKVLTTN